MSISLSVVPGDLIYDPAHRCQSFNKPAGEPIYCINGFSIRKGEYRLASAVTDFPHQKSEEHQEQQAQTVKYRVLERTLTRMRADFPTETHKPKTRWSPPEALHGDPVYRSELRGHLVQNHPDLVPVFDAYHAEELLRVEEEPEFGIRQPQSYGGEMNRAFQPVSVIL